MNKRYILLFFLVLFVSSCGSDAIYRIEGKLTNLEDQLVYIVYEGSESRLIDTVNCSSPGRFKTELNQEGFHTATLYFNERQTYVVVYLEPNRKVSINGDIHYPTLLQIKGGRINEKLSNFRKNISPLLKEQSDLIDALNLKSEVSLGDTDISARLINVNHQIEEAVQAYICDNPDEEATVVLMGQYYVIPDDTHKIDEMLALLTPRLNDFYLVRDLRNFSEQAKRTKVGAEAPDFSVMNLQGKLVSLDSLRSDYRLIAFTAPWPDMCQIDVLYLDKVATKYKKEDLEILLISLDDNPAEVREMIKKDSIQWNLVTDSANQAAMLLDLYNVSALPRCFLLDEEGGIILKTDNGEELKQTLENLIDEKEI